MSKQQIGFALNYDIGTRGTLYISRGYCIKNELGESPSDKDSIENFKVKHPILECLKWPT